MVLRVELGLMAQNAETIGRSVGGAHEDITTTVRVPAYSSNTRSLVSQLLPDAHIIPLIASATVFIY